MGSKKTALIMILILCLILSTPSLVRANEDSWVTKESMQEARSGLGVAVVNGKIYAIGGTTASGFLPSAPSYMVLSFDIGGHVGTNEEYNPATDTWTFKTPMPTPRIVFATAVYQNKIYCIGGKTDDGYTGANEVYDPLTDTWETKTSMPKARGWLTANVVGDKIYLIGGSHNETTNQVYDPATDSWTFKKHIPTSAYMFVSAVVDGKIYFISDTGSTLIYDPEADEWSSGAPSPSSVGSGAAVATTGVLAPKRIYVLGVFRNIYQGEPQKIVRVYSPETDNWTFGTDAPTKRYNFGVAVINDILYVIGGHTHNWIPGDFAPSAVNEQYTPIGYIPEFQPWLVLPLFLTATLVVALYRKQLTRNKAH